MKIQQALFAEHAVLYCLLDQIDERAESWSLEQAQEFGRALDRALRSHARVEDELLFAALEPHLGREMGPLAVMRMEHQEIEGALDRLPGTREAGEARLLLLGMSEVARSHFAKEEQILFPMAERALGPDVLERLGADWESRRFTNQLHSHCGAR